MRMAKVMQPTDFYNVKVGQNKNKLTTKEICEKYGYSTTVVNCMKRCKTYKEYKTRFCGSKRPEVVKKPAKRAPKPDTYITVVANDDRRVDRIAAVLSATIAIALIALILFIINGGK